jgi:EAL domain-containing protein (putative c-di-GMP-specific phosphodiesterase class I)
LLAEAVENGWFQLVFQPVVELSSRRPVGAEVLLRMAHPQHGLLTPATFIDVLETSDLGQGIERWVLEEACRSLQEWPDGLLPGLSINVSGRLAASGALARTVMTAADAAGIDPARLTIELTERVLVQAGTAVVGDLDALTGQGVRLAIDDFGTGYSSLTYLQQFPISTIKIDRSFVAGLGNRPRDDAIVAAVCALGAALNLAVVAEGIEDERQVEALRGAGCRHGQGYLFGKPAQRDAFSAWLGGAATAT